MIEGAPKFNGLAVLEIEAMNYASEGGPSLVAHAAFINTKTGETYGRTTCRRWSKETMRRLEEFKQAIEQDIGKMVFEGEPSGLTKSPEDMGGIAEHAAGDATQI